MAHSLLAGRGGSETRTYLNKTAREGDRECIKQSRQLTAIEFVRLCFGADNDDVIYSKTLCFVVASLSLPSSTALDNVLQYFSKLRHTS